MAEVTRQLQELLVAELGIARLPLAKVVPRVSMAADALLKPDGVGPAAAASHIVFSCAPVLRKSAAWTLTVGWQSPLLVQVIFIDVPVWYCAGPVRDSVLSAIAVLPEVQQLAASVYSFGPA